MHKVFEKINWGSDAQFVRRSGHCALNAGVLLPHYRSKESLDADELGGLDDGGDQQDEERRRSPLTAGTSSDGDEGAQARPALKGAAGQGKP